MHFARFVRVVWDFSGRYDRYELVSSDGSVSASDHADSEYFTILPVGVIACARTSIATN